MGWWKKADVVLGLTGAAATARMMQGLLYETPAVNPVAYTVVAVFMLVVSACGAWLPARRTAAISPMTALRED